MKKRTYFVIFCALCLSAVMLGFSYARESGTNQETFLKQEKENNLRVIYSEDYLSTNNQEGTDISIINHNTKESMVSLEVVKRDDTVDETVYYSINGGEVNKLNTSLIELGTLNSYGMNGDHATYNIRISSKSDEEITYDFKVVKEERKTFKDYIKDSKNIYVDDNNNLRYYGSNVLNYIRYDGIKYRIVGEFNGKFRLITEIMDESDYETAMNKGKLLSVDDYLRSFKEGIILEEEVKSNASWLKEQQYWLLDNKDGKGYVASLKLGIYTDDKPHNNRYIREIDSNCYYVTGDGSASNPYEVTYGS